MSAVRYDEFGRLKKKFRGGGDADRKAREAAALARLRGDPPPNMPVRPVWPDPARSGQTCMHAAAGAPARQPRAQDM